ncbi:hypothetical protein K5549_004988 [Capra hircus]|nr:hypothetical protein K5549_004988 [Capra hircus]
MCGICWAISFSDLKEYLLCNLKRRGPIEVNSCQGPMEDERGNVLLWNREVFSGIKVQAEENDMQIMFHYLSSCKNESDILLLFSKVQGPCPFIYYQASSHSLWFGRDFLGHRSLLWHFRNLGKSFCLSLVGTQASGWQEVPASGIFRIDLKSVSISKSVVLKLYPWEYNSARGRRY